MKQNLLLEIVSLTDESYSRTKPATKEICQTGLFTKNCEKNDVFFEKRISSMHTSSVLSLSPPSIKKDILGGTPNARENTQFSKSAADIWY